MNVETKFRGIRIDNGEWIFGDLIYHKRFIETKPYIKSSITGEMVFIEVNPESVGQFSGLKDKADAEIYKDDILNGCTFNGVICYGKVEFYNGRFCAFPIGTYKEGLSDFYYILNHVEVIGNIHQNPELL